MALIDTIFISGTDDPTIVAKDADSGTLYVNITNSKIYTKNDDGNTTNWSMVGGASLIDTHGEAFIPSNLALWATFAPTSLGDAVNRIASVIGATNIIP